MQSTEGPGMISDCKDPSLLTQTKNNDNQNTTNQTPPPPQARDNPSPPFNTSISMGPYGNPLYIIDHTTE